MTFGTSPKIFASASLRGVLLTIAAIAVSATVAAAAEEGLDAPASGAGSWAFSRATNDAGQVVAYRLELPAQQEFQGQRLRFSKPRLTINCSPFGTDVWIESDLDAKGPNVDVTLVFDGEPPQNLNWGNSGDGRYAGLWGRGGAFINRALGHRSLSVSFDLGDGQPSLVWFDLTGLARAARELGDSCDWRSNPGLSLQSP